MGFTTEEYMVRVDFFKPSGKWYTTEAVEWTGDFHGIIGEEFAKSLRVHFRDHPTRLAGMTAVCLHPFHAHPFPFMIPNGKWNRGKR